MKSLTHEEFTNRFYSMHEPGEYTVLSKFINSSTDVVIRHNKCGTVYNAKPYNLYMGKGCKKCCMKRFTFSQQEFVDKVKQKYGDEYTVLGKYVNSKTKILVRHNKCGSEYNAIPDTLLRGHKCKKCAGLAKYSTEQVKKQISDITDGEYELASEYIANNKKIKVLHKQCGTTFETTYSLFATLGSRCPLCNKDYRRTPELFRKEFYNLVKEEYDLIGEFKSVSSKILIKHNTCGKKYEVTPASFLRGSRCPYCNESKGEITVRTYLSEHGIDFERQYRFSDCADKYTLPFDFAVLKNGCLLCLIEYQGEQHFKSLERFGWNEKFTDRKRKDSIKKQYCQNNHIPLIEIPYTVKDVGGFLEDKLNKI